MGHAGHAVPQPRPRLPASHRQYEGYLAHRCERRCPQGPLARPERGARRCRLSRRARAAEVVPPSVHPQRVLACAWLDSCSSRVLDAYRCVSCLRCRRPLLLTQLCPAVLQLGRGRPVAVHPLAVCADCQPRRGPQGGRVLDGYAGQHGRLGGGAHSRSNGTDLDVAVPSRLVGWTEIMAQITACSKQYIENKCIPVETRLPAMETLCTTWEKYPPNT